MAIKTLNSLIVQTPLLAAKAFTTPATTLTTSGLSIQSDTPVIVDFRLALASGITTDISFFINGDTTLSNYHNKREKYITTVATIEAQTSDAKLLAGITSAEWGGMGHIRLELICGLYGTFWNYNASAIHNDVWVNFEGHVRYVQSCPVITSIGFMASSANSLTGNVVITL